MKFQKDPMIKSICSNSIYQMKKANDNLSASNDEMPIAFLQR